MANKKRITKNDLSKSLKENTEILDMTFEEAGLKVIKFGIRPYDPDDDDDYDANLFLEVYATETLSNVCHVKVVFYDKEGDILLTDFRMFEDGFKGLDVISMQMSYDNSLWKYAVSGKIFVNTI